MKYLSEFRNSAPVRKLTEEIDRVSRGAEITLMEVCGTHTVSIFRSGLRSLLPFRLRLLSGPGCPVCVTPLRTLDAVIAYARRPDTVIATFGDMLDVPGSRSSLRKEKSRGADVRLVYSPRESLRLARSHPWKKVIFLATGFETTMPAIGATLAEAKSSGLNNFSIIPAGKLIPPAMEALLAAGESKIDGFLCPGHVSVIIGIRPYRKIARRYTVPCVIAGFEPVDILLAIRELIILIKAGKGVVKNLYLRAVRDGGNPKARQFIREVFTIEDSQWRGLGKIPKSGYFLKEKYRRFDIQAVDPLDLPPPRENPQCLCGEILRGIREPKECPAFGKSCTPSRPLGPCMVSSEGTCAAWFRYRRQ